MTRHGSIGKRGITALLVAAALFVTVLPAAARTVTDQLGRTVAIPDKVERVVCLQHHALNLMLEMQAGDRLVGILDTWKKDLSEGIL
jgi:iron complex transport system substrate-binding protein